MNDLDKKIKFAIHLLQSIPQDREIEVAYSTGKDSDVILQLAKEAGIPYRAIYKNTTIDRVGSIAHAKQVGAEIVNPQKSFFEIIRESGIPSRWLRFCCSHLKEYKILDRVIMGVRRSESTKRAKRYHEPEECRIYKDKSKVKAYYPILDWTNEDVERFIKERELKCHPWYYDEEGNFHVERRVGCMGCPLSGEKGLREQFTQYPKLLRLWIANAQIYLDNHSHVKTYENFDGDAYKWMFCRLFFSDKYREYKASVGVGIFPELKLDCKQFLEDYFKIDLTPPKFYR